MASLPRWLRRATVGLVTLALAHGAHADEILFLNGDRHLEFLPNFTEPFQDYLLNLDAGLRAAIIGSFFAEFSFELSYDSMPAPGSKKDDLRYVLGVGWTF